MTTTRALVAAACLAVAAAVGGCAGDGPAATGSTIELMPSANPFTSAVVFTNGLGTARLAITNTVTVGADTTTRTGDVVAAMDPRGYGSGEWTQGRATVEELAADKAVYERTAGATGPWTAHPEGERTLTSALLAPLTGLGELSDVRAEGAESIGDVIATRYTGTLAATPDRLRALGLTDADLAVVGEAAAGAPITVTAWVDGSNRIVRVDREYRVTAPDGTPVRAATTTRMREFTADLDLVPPKSGDVTSLSPTGTADPASPT